jgi:MbtH protein
LLPISLSEAQREFDGTYEGRPGKVSGKLFSQPGAPAAAPRGPEYAVVVNNEGQHSLWPASLAIPPGWQEAGFRGDAEQCLDTIAEVWTDMRPQSVREAVESRR